MKGLVAPAWLQALIDAKFGERLGILWHTADERLTSQRIRPSQMPPGNRRLTDDQRQEIDEGWDEMTRVAQGPQFFFNEENFLVLEYWVYTAEPDLLWVSLLGQPTFLWFPAGRDAASLMSAIRPYLPTDLARPRTPQTTEQARAQLAAAAGGPTPGPAPGQNRVVRLLVGLALAHNGETLHDFDMSLLKTGVVDPRFVLQGSIANNPRSNPAVTVVRTLYSRSTVRLDWYDKLDGVVIAEIAYAPAMQQDTIEALNEQFRLHYPLDIPVDVPALLLGLEAISAPALLEHMKRVQDPELLVSYLNCLVLLTEPEVAEYLRPFMSHPARGVRDCVLHYATRMAPELLGELQDSETDPDLRSWTAAPAHEPLRDVLAKALNQSPGEPANDAYVLLNPHAKSDLDAVIASIAAIFPFAPAVTISRHPEAWGPSFHIGLVTVASYILDMPLPADYLEASARLSWLWPTAEADLRGHTQMITLSAAGGETPAERMNALTMLAAAIIGTCPQAVGVYWGAANHLVRGDVFRDGAARLMPEQLPLLLWIGMPVWQNPDGTSSGYTVGLREFDGPELEVCDAPLSVRQLRERLSELAAEFVANGLNVPDGVTVNVSATHAFTVSHGESQFGLPGPVMRCQYFRTG